MNDWITYGISNRFRLEKTISIVFRDPVDTNSFDGVKEIGWSDIGIGNVVLAFYDVNKVYLGVAGIERYMIVICDEVLIK